MTVEFRADLHCHSFYSDGTDSPEALIQLAIEKKLTGLSITDHDTISAYPEAIQIAGRFNLPLIVGVEFSSNFRCEPVHILGYSFDLKSQEIARLCEKHKKRRQERNNSILKKLKALGISSELFSLENIEGTIGRPHIAKFLMEIGIVQTIQEAFERYLGEGKPAFDPGEPISVEETIETIHQAKGVAILAHPHLLKRSITTRELLKMPFDGLEGYYARFGPAREKKWVDIARTKGWLITGGSDYHGATKPHSLLGSSWVGEKTFECLYHRFKQANLFA